jgi:hypothetical protein
VSGEVIEAEADEAYDCDDERGQGSPVDIHGDLLPVARLIVWRRRSTFSITMPRRALHPTSDQPLHEQVAASLRCGRAIVEDCEPGGRLPAASKVAAALAVNVNTVPRALRSLRSEAWFGTGVGGGDGRCREELTAGAWPS